MSPNIVEACLCSPAGYEDLQLFIVLFKGWACAPSPKAMPEQVSTLPEQNVPWLLSSAIQWQQ